MVMGNRPSKIPLLVILVCREIEWLLKLSKNGLSNCHSTPEHNRAV